MICARSVSLGATMAKILTQAGANICDAGEFVSFLDEPVEIFLLGLCRDEGKNCPPSRSQAVQYPTPRVLIGRGPTTGQTR